MSKITVKEFSTNLDKFRVPLSSFEREKRKGLIPYYGAAKIIDYVDGFTHTGLSVLIAEDGSVETKDGYPVVQLANGEYWVNNHTHVLKGRDDIDTTYLYYALQTIKVAPFVTGAVQKKISQQALNSMEIPYFEDKTDRKRIVEILSSFDEKIQLNTQINQTLEQIAQALFKSWFVDFDPVRAKVQALSDGLSLEQAELAAMQTISGKTPEELTALSQTQPERYAELAETAKAFPCEMVEVDGVDVPKGWEVKPLPEIIDFLEGPGIRNWQYTEEEDGIKFINIRCIQNGDLTLTTANKITKEEVFGKYKHFQLEEDDIVVSTSGTLGRFAFVRKEHLPLSLNTSVIRFRPIKNKSTLGFIAGFVENQLQHELEIRASGSAQRNFGPTHLKQISLLVPDFKLLELHQKYASSLFEKRKQLLSEIDTLKDTRDLLLPRLLKGEI
ncbi:TPA: restriction endonuclease subunit S [Haemophilus influenzae]|uniref:EcoKI restriction-modification system protein HsdS n=1 Tax=Haemophilus influenzae TaxID=727 RepID=A0ABD6WPP0_HAEIF|nr:restriction endonuclease subunit S [Haemophilus influenzae]MCK8983758.1 restriction endonuclease subunit S [Haemophilus influenzae]MCK9027928.1 restriction endonuclease subunit S [Haemophilus influenzae]PRL89039.1 EcoKI restriction-modification system protein HsdS [Haemophilus influenzae]PRL90896.1 EcoKI restriction-modification system protein HsdS [Haemophilus influenzae]